jgi:Family of unknown function (DUF6011)
VSAQQASRPATENQITTLKDMLSKLAAFDRERAVTLWTDLGARQQEVGLDFDTVSTAMTVTGDLLRAFRQAQRAEVAAEETAALAAVSTGRYAVDTDEGHLGFYKVWKSDDGKKFAVYVLASDDEHRMVGRAAQGVLRKITEVGPLVASARYGNEIGVCGVCNRKLTDEKSRAAGIGPICASRLG